MELLETSFEELSARFGEDVAKYMRVIIEYSRNRHNAISAIEVTLDALSDRYGEPAAEAILREIEKVADRDMAAVDDYHFRTMEVSEPDFSKRFRLPAMRSLLPYELDTLRRLVVYIAANDNMPPEHLEKELIQNFDVLTLSQLESTRFPDAVEHLLDLSEGRV